MAEYVTKGQVIDWYRPYGQTDEPIPFETLVSDLRDMKAADVAPVRHGRWLLQANNERTNYRWNVTAECSECCDEEKEIWAGFFPNVPDWLARDVALESAKSVKLSNYCPNCGAKMDGGFDNGCVESV